MQTSDADALVSIIIATYNASALLPACFASIKALENDKIEVVLVDGGSTDDTVELIQSFDYPLKKWISEPDKGIYDAFNKGILLATGRWIHFLGSDDLVLPGFNTMLQELRERHTIYYGNSVPYFLTGERVDFELLGGKFTPYRLAKYPVNHQAIFYPAEVFKLFRYNTAYRIFADYALNIQIWRHPRFSTKYIDIDLVNYNMNGFSSSQEDHRFKVEKPDLIRTHLGVFTYWRFRWKKHRKIREGGWNW